MEWVYQRAIDRLINWQIAKAGATGFITGVGGMLTLPVTIPANVAGVSYLQLRMIAAIAHLRGYEARDDRVRTLAFICLTGSNAFDVLKDVGVQVGTKLTQQMMLRISGATLRRINQAVGFRLVTKAGSRGVVNLVKVVPIVGGVVGGSLDAAATKIIGATPSINFDRTPSLWSLAQLRARPLGNAGLQSRTDSAEKPARHRRSRHVPGRPRHRLRR